MTVGVSEFWIEVISSEPIPLTRKRFSVTMAPAKIAGMPRAISVTTGIRLLRTTWRDDHRALGKALGSRGTHILQRQIVEHRRTHEAGHRRRLLHHEHGDRQDHLAHLLPEGLPACVTWMVEL